MRKIFDVLPPQKIDKISKEKEPRKIKRKIKWNLAIRAYYLLLVILMLIVLFFLVSIHYSSVQVKIWQNLEEFTLKERISANTKISEMNLKEKILPAKILEIEEIVSHTFPSTGEIKKKAEGKVRLFNSYSLEEEVWRAGTRFISSDGKLFFSKDKIVVPPAKESGGKIEPSFVDVEVIAGEGGQDYNIAPTKFSIPAFRGTERYFKYYAESYEPMKGGGIARVVKKEDLENAEKVLKEKILKEIGFELLNQRAEEDFILAKEGFVVDVLDKNFSASEGQETESFSLKMKIRLKGVILKKKELGILFQNLLSSKLDPQKKTIPEKERVELTAIGKDFDKGNFLLDVTLSTLAYTKVDVESLRKEIADKKIQEAKKILENIQGISRSEIKVSPFWLKKIPENLRRIKIEVVPLE